MPDKRLMAPLDTFDAPTDAPTRQVVAVNADVDDSTTLSEVRLPPVRRWTVDVADPSGTRRAHLREGESLEIGSHASATLRIEDRTVSAKHCVIWVDGGRLRFADSGSRNGTFAGGSRVNRGEVDPHGVLVVGRTVLSFAPHVRDDAEELLAVPPLDGIVGLSVAMRRVARDVRRVAPLRVPVLVRGETGTGKELVARAVHTESQRASQPFLALNMGAMPNELIDAELFGHERGAFTGAVSSRVGAFELAKNGTIFLDEIAELAFAMQAKLLRVLEGGEIRSIGGGLGKRVDVRVVAATWAPLEQRVYDGLFREDLFHRLAVLPIELPALRDRRVDIPLIAEDFLAKSEVGPKQLSSGALSRLVAHSWPGNVRELRNVLFRAATMTNDGQITSENIHTGLGRPASVPPPRGTVAPLRDRTEEVRQALAVNQGNVSKTSRDLGIARATVRAWAK